jgi:hypothetical protein
MTRTQIRYALFRCKAGTADKSQLKILESYQSQLKEFDMNISDFTLDWDVSPKDLSEIVIGKEAKKLNKDKSLFTGDGSLKVK